MNKEFCTYEQALALKELGFDEPCFTFYPKEGKMGFDGKYHSIKEGYRNSTVNDIWIKRYKKDFQCIAAPTFSQAFRWFRTKNIDSAIFEKHKDLGKFYGGYTKQESDNFGKSFGSNFKTYEEAELACLKKLIEIIKLNKQD